ncbi:MULTISPECIES: DUF7210 family protein [Paenibacillus]|uniref:DUF7210 family protein n=1 Tax=Paenibacillus TaxID=44249 RepID=UPI00096F9E26|nr:hypothetical protein [Paenibacillus odorifer]OMD06274.1 hypothetical protein BJP50_31905 [Paenibacillus odorifer]
MKVEVKEIPIRHNGQLFQKGESFSVTEKDYERLEKHVTFIEDEGPPAVSEMKLAELKAHAKEHGIDLGEASKREDVLAVVLKAGVSDGGAS